MIDPYKFLFPRTISAKDLITSSNRMILLDVAGYFMRVGSTGRGRIEVAARPHCEAALLLDETAFLEVWEFDGDSYAVEKTAEKLAMVDGSTKWDDLHDEDQDRWRRLARAVSPRAEPFPDRNLRRPVADPEVKR